MKKVEFLDTDIHIAFIDIEKRRAEIAKDCLNVWDSMSGKLPSFQCFCQSYMWEKFNEWLEKARWN